MPDALVQLLVAREDVALLQMSAIAKDHCSLYTDVTDGRPLKRKNEYREKVAVCVAGDRKVVEIDSKKVGTGRPGCRWPAFT